MRSPLTTISGDPDRTDVWEASRSPRVWVVTLTAAALLLATWLLPPLWVAAAIGAAVLVALILRYPLFGFGLLAFSVPWGSGFTPGGSSFPISSTEVIVAAIGTAWIASAIVFRTNPFDSGPWLPYVGLFLAAILLSVSQASDTHASLREVLKWAEMTVVYLAAVSVLRTRRQVGIILAAVIAGGVSQSLLGFVQFALNLGPRAFAAQRLFLRAYGTFDQPNPYAGYLNMVLPLALALALVGPAGRWRYWSRLSVVLLGAAVLASESRGALLATLLAVTLMLAILFPAWARLVWLGVLAGLIFIWLALYGLPLGPLERVLNAVGLGGVTFGSVTDANFSAVERAAHWLAGVRMFAAHPLLGVGIGNYSAAYPIYHPRGWYASLQHAHNYYINIAAEAGIIGLVTYLLLAGSALWYSYASISRARDSLLRAAGLGVFGALITTGFHNIFDVLYVHGTTALIGLYLALVMIAMRAEADPAVAGATSP